MSKLDCDWRIWVKDRPSRVVVGRAQYAYEAYKIVRHLLAEQDGPPPSFSECGFRRLPDVTARKVGAGRGARP